jgi:ribosomal protein S18 acetylase RimI-like enzyme
LTYSFHNAVLGVFSSHPDVIARAWQFSSIIIPFYIVLGFAQILPGALRGAGNVKFSTAVCVMCYVVVRQIYLFIVTKTQYTVVAVALGYPMTWTLCAAIIFIYYISKKRIPSISLTHVVHTDGLNADFIKLCERLDRFQNKTVPGRRAAGLSSVYNLENLKDIFLLYSGRRVIGSAGLWCHDDQTCEAIRVYVDSLYRDKGYEKLLLDEVQKLAQSRGYNQILIRTYKNTQDIVNAYEKIGFAAVEPEEFKYIDKYPQAVQLAAMRVYMRMDITKTL